VTDLDYTSLTCPMPGCGSDLHLTWTHTRPLFAGDVEPISPAEAYTGSWQVECVEGHVVLLPSEDTDHLCEGDCKVDVDHDDELRTFRASDLTRLRALLEQMAGAK
jgi:hypothetical protein